MAYVIAEPCIGTKDTACVDACPVDCIHPKKDEEKHATEEMLYIDPVECIDCGACINAGPGVSTRPDQVVISAQNRNFPGRSGPGQMYLASPLTVAASAVAGHIVEYEPAEERELAGARK